jgi:hypothetical protein
MSFKAYLYLGGFLALLAAAGGIYYKGWSSCQKMRDAEQAQNELKGYKLYDRTEKEVLKLSDPDLDVRLARWMRD